MKKNLLLAVTLLFSFTTFAQQTGSFTRSVVIGGGATTLNYYVPATYDSTKTYKFILNLEPAAQGHFPGYADTADAIVVGTSKTAFSDLTEIVDSTNQWYNFSYSDIYLSGFSSKGAAAISVGMANTSYFKGMVLLAPASTSGINYANSKNIPTCIVTGANDGFLTTTNSYYASITGAGGLVDTAIVPGIGHTPVGPDARTPRIAECFSYVDANLPTSLHDLSDDKVILQLYPNPASKQVWLNSESNIERIELVDVNGKLVYSQKLQDIEAPFALDVRSFSNGLYFIKVYSGDRVSTQKVLVNN